MLTLLILHYCSLVIGQWASSNRYIFSGLILYLAFDNEIVVITEASEFESPQALPRYVSKIPLVF